jgi:hypothetical protein
MGADSSVARKTVERVLGIDAESVGRSLRNNGYTNDTGRPYSKTLPNPRGWKIHVRHHLNRDELITQSVQVPFADQRVTGGTTPVQPAKSEENLR